MQTKRFDFAVVPVGAGVLCLAAALLRPALPLPSSVTSGRLFTLFVVCIALAIVTRVGQGGWEAIARQRVGKHYTEIVIEALIFGGALLIATSTAYSVFIGGMYARAVISSRPVITAFAMIVAGLLLGVLKAGTAAVKRRVEKQEYLSMIIQALVLVSSSSLLIFLEWKLLIRVLR